jgi:hypothetical protein
MLGWLHLESRVGVRDSFEKPVYGRRAQRNDTCGPARHRDRVADRIVRYPSHSEVAPDEGRKAGSCFSH